MKKIISGKKYDTETANEIGYDSNEKGSNLDWWGETLYQKRTGEFFLFGEGGPRSRYWNSSSQIIPLTWDAARSWAEAHLAADIFEEVFGEITKDETKKVFPLNVKVSLLEKIKRSASQQGISASTLVETALEQYFRKSE